MGPKTRAEIQKAYRERKKALGGQAYLQKEVGRVQKYYKPTATLSKSELENRRENIRISVEKHRAGIKSQPSASTSNEKLVVKLDFRRRTAELKSARNKIRHLEKRLENLERSNKRIRKRNERLASGSTLVEQKNMTPRTRTNAQIRKAGLRLQTLPKQLKRKLLFSNVLADEIKHSLASNKGTSSKQVIRNVVSGRIVKKYRLVREMNKAVGISRNSLLGAKTKFCGHTKKLRLHQAFEAKKESVRAFLERDDNSRMMPGKNDAKKSIGGKKLQKRVLCDYMYNLHAKYQAEHQNEKISRASFCRLRPRHIVLANFASRDTCLCQRHQNLALKLHALKAKGVTNTINPDKFISENKDDEEVNEILTALPDSGIEYDQWKRVEDEDGKKRMKIVKLNLHKADFVAVVENEVREFRQHAGRVKQQYLQLTDLKTNLPKGHVVVQMDFAENYLCQSLQAVQSSYWNGTMVSLHPVVTYFKDDNGSLQHKSFVFTSDELSHNATAVFSIIQKLIIELKQLVSPPLLYIHYWTDSPTSQYRNKTMFAVTANHPNEFGMAAVWNYFEAGHGKGPCDGVGGTAKRMADDAVKTGKATIQDAHEFFTWASTSQSNSSLEYRFYTKEDYTQAEAYLLRKYSRVEQVKGTMKLHSVAGVSQEQIKIRATSCYCDKCLTAEGFEPSPTCGWTTCTILREVEGNIQNQLQLHTNDWVAAVYDESWYIGQVDEIDNADDEVLVSFMVKGKGKHSGSTFKWPARKDDLWVSKSNVLCVIEPPAAVGKTGRTYQLSAAAIELIEQRHSSLNA